MVSLMEQGWGGVLDEPCGTDGLGTCLGVVYPVAPQWSQWFVAHIDCVARVTRRDATYDAVVRWVWQRMQDVCGNFQGETLVLCSTGSDFSTFAMTDGVRFWANQQDWPVTAWDGVIVANGQFSRAPAGLANNVRGFSAFTVPANPLAVGKARSRSRQVDKPTSGNRPRKPG